MNPTIIAIPSNGDQYRTVRIKGKRVQQLIPGTHMLALVNGHPQSVRKDRKAGTK